MKLLCAVLLTLGLAAVGCDEAEPGLDYDVGVKSIDDPSGSVAAGDSVAPKATIENRGDTVAVFNVWFFIDGPTDATEYRDSLAGQSIEPGQSRRLSFAWSGPLVEPGNWTARCSTWYDPDMDSANDVRTAGFGVEAPAEKDAVELVPLDDEISGWNRNGAMDIAENETRLYELIDGEGVPFVENGLVKFVRQFFLGQVEGSDVDLQLWVADMANATNAKNIYDLRADGTETPWTQEHAGVEARIKQTLSSYVIDFWDDKFYVWLDIGALSDPGLAVGKTFALNVSNAIHE